MPITNETQGLRAQLAELAEKVSALEAELTVERQIGALTRKKVAHCRVCQDKPDLALGHPPLTELEKAFCEQGHRFVMLAPDQFRNLRTW
jgi:PP-loop superfamily ATP-utilizing enzyme